MSQQKGKKRRWSKTDEEWLSPRVRKKMVKQTTATTGDGPGAAKVEKKRASLWPEEDQLGFFEQVIARKQREKGGADPNIDLAARLLRHRGGLLRLSNSERAARGGGEPEAQPALDKLDLVEVLLRRTRTALTSEDGEERADACRRVDGALDALLGKSFATSRWTVVLSLLEEAGDLVRRDLRNTDAPLAFSVVHIERLARRSTSAAEALALLTITGLDESLLRSAVQAFANSSSNGSKWNPVWKLLTSAGLSTHKDQESLRLAWAGIKKRGGLPAFLRDRFPGHAEAFEASPLWRLRRP